MSPETNTDNGGEISLPSFRDGIPFKVLPLNFRGFKAVGRAEAANLSPVDIMSIMIHETLRRAFPNVTETEADDMEMDDIMKLTDLVTSTNEGLNKADFPTPTSMDS